MADESKILLVEDNPDDVDLTLRAFSKHNIANEILVARDCQEAMDFLLAREQDAALPQVVLLDLNLPRVSGLDVLRRIRANEKTRYLPVVVLTSSQEEADLIESYALGCNSYVRKPVDFNEFSEAARHLGLYWLILNKVPPRR